MKRLRNESVQRDTEFLALTINIAKRTLRASGDTKIEAINIVINILFFVDDLQVF